MSALQKSQAAPVTRPGRSIRIAGAAPPPVRFAAAELQHYLGRMLAEELSIESDATVGDSGLLLGSGPFSAPRHAGADHFSIAPTADGAVVSGGSGRAVLHGTYALLQQLGCRWPLPGHGEEVVPRCREMPRVESRSHAPRFAVRGYSADIMTWHYGDAAQLAEHLAADRQFIDWMGKSGGNAFLFIRHPFDSQLTIPELLPEFARRGIDLEYGGHVIPLLLPRELFAQQPELFPQASAGTRTEFGNLCTSNPTALQIAAANAVTYVREYPELRVLHVWGADLWGGGWCHCARCAPVSVQDQSLRLCNAVADALAAEGLGRPVCYIAYHDTIDPELRGQPSPNVWVEFAARERCYGHALNDGACRTNRRYREALERYADLFGGRVRLFEYYADAILFCGCAVPLGEVIAADLDYYHSIGVREITNLQFGSFSLWTYPLNFLVYAEAARHGGCDSFMVRADYAERFGAQSRRIAEILAELEAVMRTVVTYGDIRRPPRQDDLARALRPTVSAAVQRLGSLAATTVPAKEEGELAALQALLRYNQTLLRGVSAEINGGSGEADYQEALAIMQAVDRRFTGLWGAVNLPVIHAYLSSASGSF